MMETAIIIASLAVVGFFVWFFAFRKRKEPKNESVSPTPVPAQKPEPNPDEKPTQEEDKKEDVVEEEQTDEPFIGRMFAALDDCLTLFDDVMQVPSDGLTYSYLQKLVYEAGIQYYKSCSVNGLPYLYSRDNFPYVYNYYGDRENEDAAFMTMIGWIVALHLSELCPQKRNKLFKTGYEVAGYRMDSPIYGYEFRSDPNVARLVASAFYATMRSLLKPDTDAMRKEMGGKKYDRTLKQLVDDEPRVHVTDDAFYIDLRGFMASAPGPYAPGYTDRSKNNPTFPDEKASNGSLQMDMDIYNHIVSGYNLDGKRSVQAIADEEGDVHHLFGTDKRDIGGKYDFNAVFGQKSIGELISPDSAFAEFIHQVQRAGGSARGILQHADPSIGAIEYGRLRPGCSEQREGQRKSYDDDRLNVLSSFIIEDNDGCKQTYSDGGVDKYYYDEDGHWTNAKVQSPEDYENMSKDLLYANSYPSGHSSGIWCAAMTMMEAYPFKADLIMRAANNFAVSRTVSRYHWNSDTIQGRVLGSAMNAVCHATSDYDSSLSGD